MHIRLGTLGVTFALACLGWVPLASADATAVVIEYTAPMPDAGGQSWVFLEGYMDGSFTRGDSSTGSYRVPFQAVVPATGVSDMMILDLPTSSQLELYVEMCGREVAFCDAGTGEQGNRLQERIFPARAYFSNWWQEQGVGSFAVQWLKLVTDTFGAEPDNGVQRELVHGTIERGTDGWQIINDAARFLKNPSSATITGSMSDRFQTATYVVASAVSQSAMLLNTYNHLQLNEDLGSGNMLIDGFGLITAGGLCRVLLDDAPYIQRGSCTGNFGTDWMGINARGDEKIMHLSTQTETRIFAASGTQEQGPNHRHYEFAGVPHITHYNSPISWQNDRSRATWPPNPVDQRPYFRGGYANLFEWVRNDTAPPPSIPVARDTEDNLMYDADNNLLGGVRGVHLSTTLPSGGTVGAPAGEYGPVAWDYFYDPACVPPTPNTPVLCTTRSEIRVEARSSLSGAYLAFTDSEFRSRYATDADFYALRSAAAESLFADGYITEEDRDMFLAQANPEDLPTLPAPITPVFGEDCSVGGDGSGGSLGWLLGTLAFLGLRRRRWHLGMLGLAVTALVAGAGCGEDEVPCGHACPDAPINLPEGGEIRIEYITASSNNREIRTDAWFASAQTPESRPFSREPAEWRTAGGSDLCRIVSNDDFIPTMVPSSRTYREFGETLTVSGPAGAVNLNRISNLQSDANDFFHDVGYAADVMPSMLPLGSIFEITAADGTDFGSLRVPDSYAISYPDFSARIILPAGVALPVIWSTTGVGQEFEFAFVVFADVYGPLVRCIGPNTGVMEIPQEIMNILPGTGVMQHGVFDHEAVNVDGRRVDKIGISCFEAPFELDGARM